MPNLVLPDPNRLRIVKYPDPALRVTASPVGEPDARLKEVGQRMKELMLECGGIGLAATQVAWPRRVVVLTLTGEPKDAEVFIDPMIIKRAGRVSEEEGCLSVPGLRAKVRRSERIVVKATRLSGEEITIEAEGLIARLWQHEIDHLDGSLFIDKVGPTTRILIARRLRELEEQFQKK